MSSKPATEQKQVAVVRPFQNSPENSGNVHVPQQFATNGSTAISYPMINPDFVTQRSTGAPNSFTLERFDYK